METATFAELGLSAKVLAAIDASGYTTPTPIQAQAIPVAMTGRDVLGIAQTGTGKTASFVLPMITRLETGRARARMPRSLILCPTRELAAQCEQSFVKYGVNHKLDVALLIGGVSMDEQVRKLDRGVDVLIATPGRLLDHFGRGRIMLMGVEILVIDEADRMLDMGFIPDIEKICKLLPPKRQTLFFSATMPAEITRLVDQFLTDPVRIEVARPATAAATITQRFAFCSSSEDWAKREVLRHLIGDLDVKNAIIFCNRKRDVAILLKSLLKHGFNAGALHGDMDQSSRTATLDKFRNGEIALLAASDVAARGLDIPDVSHIFNFDVPWQADDYVHRIGRTGRAGKEGFSATIVTPEDVKSIDSISKLIGEEPKWLGEAPSEADLADGRSRKRGRGRGASAGGASRGVGRGRGEARGSRSGEARGSSSGEARGGRSGEARSSSSGEARGGGEGRGAGGRGRSTGGRDRGDTGGDRAEGRQRRGRGGAERGDQGALGQPEQIDDVSVAATPAAEAPARGERRPRRDRERGRERDRERQPDEMAVETIGGDAPQHEAREPRDEGRNGGERGRSRGERGGSRGERRPSRLPEPELPQFGAANARPGAERDARRAEARERERERDEQAPRRDADRDRSGDRGGDRDRGGRGGDRGGDRGRSADAQPSRGGGGGGGNAQKGLGDHVPAFLRRPGRANAE